MTDTQEQSVITDAAQLERELAELEAELTRQLQMVTAEDYDSFIVLGERVGERLDRVTSAQAPLTHVSFEHIKQIHVLHHKLGLMLASRSDEMAQKMAKIRSGKAGLKAYKNGAC